MKYLRTPRFVARNTVEYGYFPQDKLVEPNDPLYCEKPYLQDENQVAVYNKSDNQQEHIFFAQGKFYCRKPVSLSKTRWIYEYEPLLWRVYARQDNLLYMISDRVLLQGAPKRIEDDFGIGAKFRAIEREFLKYALFVERDFLEPTLVGDRRVGLGARKRLTSLYRVFAPSYLECQKMKASDLSHWSEKPFLVAAKTRFSNQGELCEESFGTAFLTSSFVGKEGKDQICFVPSENGILNFKAFSTPLWGIRPCIVIKEENIEKAY